MLSLQPSSLRVVLILVGVCAVAAPADAQTRADSAQHYLMRAEQLATVNWSDARRNAQRAIRLGSGNVLERDKLARAHLVLGTAYLYDDGGQDYAAAEEYLREAANLGAEDSHLHLGILLHVQGRGSQALEELQRVVRNDWPGAVEAYYRMGLIHINATGVPADTAEAVRLFERSNTNEAHLLLGNLYYTGRGVGQDFSAALNHFREAASGDNAAAWYAIAMMLTRGEGIERSPGNGLLAFCYAANNLEHESAGEVVGRAGIECPDLPRDRPADLLRTLLPLDAIR